MQTLTRPQREAVFLLQFGTILEYFDFMLYIHMAVFLNDLFFPQVGEQNKSMLSAFTISTTFALRPLGALLFGYIGDKLGRKATITITTAMMAVSCIIMANVPTYAEIGMTATWIVLFCRALQGISSMGEAVGAEVYLTETIKPPLQYPIVAICGTMCSVGSFLAMGVATLSTSYGFNWRMAFWIGAAIAVIGSVARSRLRETPEFLQISRRHATYATQENFEANPIARIPEAKSSVFKQINFKVMLAHFTIQCASPVLFYFAYIYCGEVLKSKFGFTTEEVIARNLLLTVTELVSLLAVTILTFKIYPLKLNMYRWAGMASVIIFIAFGFDSITSAIQMAVLQCLIAAFKLYDVPSSPIFYKYMPTAVRLRCATMSFALGRAFTYVITAYGYVYLTDRFGSRGSLFILVPMIVSHFFALRFFYRLDRKSQSGGTGRSDDRSESAALPRTA